MLYVHTTHIHMHVHTAHIHMYVHTAHIHMYVHTTHIHMSVYTAHIHMYVYTTHIHMYVYTAHIHRNCKRKNPVTKTHTPATLSLAYFLSGHTRIPAYPLSPCPHALMPVVCV